MTLTGSLWLVWVVFSGSLALALVPGTLELLWLTLAGLFRPRRLMPPAPGAAFGMTVVIPAHNEELLIARCVRSLLMADSGGIDLRVVVVADNCTDDTARRAGDAGAEVLERCDLEHRGKGPALQFAFATLRHVKTAAFAVIDADTEVAANFLTETAAALRAGAEATQCRYLVRAAVETPRNQLVRLVSAAYNIVRARGRAVLGFSAGIYGNGFALSQATLDAVPYSAHSIVEDIEYHLALITKSRRVVFLDRTAVTADLPVSARGAESQRARWDGGRLLVARTHLPRVIVHLLRGEFRFLEATFDLTLPPLVFYALLLLIVCFSPWTPVRCFGVAGLSVTVLHLATAAFVGGRGFADLRALLAIPLFVAWKIALLPNLLRTSRGGAQWVRTDRSPGAMKP